MRTEYDALPSPCFVLEEELLRQNLELLQHVQEETGCAILLALKGVSMFSAFPLMRPYLSGVTASSLNEARLGFEEFGGEVHACAPVYADAEIDEWISYVSHMTFNSLSQWDRFKTRMASVSDRVSCGLRVNPEHSEVSTDLYNPGQPGSRLGIPADELDGGLPDGLEGVHMHVLCECNADALDRAVDVLERKFGSLLASAQWLNLGGGHHITRNDYDVPHLIRIVQRLREKYDARIILEPGEAVGWRTGVLVATVMDVVKHGGITTVMLDTSFSAHMPDCLEMPYKPAVRGARDPAPDEPGVRLGGNTCLAGDYVGEYVFDHMPRAGDRLVLEDMIHYTMVKTTMFNGVRHPAIAIHRETGKFDIIREFGYADYRNRLS